MRSRIALTLLAWVLLPPGRALAGDPGEAEKRLERLTLEDLMRIDTGSASKLEQPASEAPALLSVFARDQIQSYGWISLNDILYQQPGFAPSQDYDRRTVSARGLFEGWNNNHLLLLIDGVPMNDPVYGSAYTWEITPLFLARTVEIIRGPGSALYGSNATNGVIALNTREADPLEPAIEGQLRIGNDNTQIYDLFASHQFRHAALVVGFNRYNTDGNSYSDFDGSGRTNSAGGLMRFHVGDARSSDYVFAKLTISGGLTIQFHHQDWTYQTGHGWIWFIPDRKEGLSEQRQIVSLNYRPPALARGRFTQQYVLQYQRHGIDWNVNFYPNGTVLQQPNGAPVVYPAGVMEALDTQTHDLFTRVEYSYRFWRDMTALIGFENSLFIYTGDDHHAANADLNTGGTGLPWPDGANHPLRPWLAYIQNHPVDNAGAYVQYTSGRMFGRRLAVTAGVRDDLESFQYTDIAAPDKPQLRRTFNQISPRLGVVIFPWRDLVLKALFDRAFRAPAPAELFGANTLTLNSSPNTLKPEQISTVSLSAELPLMHKLNLRADWFYERFENEIAYSVSRVNLSANLYSRTVTGVEAELWFDTAIGWPGWLRGYFNYSFVHLVEEQIEDPLITPSNQLTWAPAHTFNLGLNWVGHGFNASAQGHFQGPVERRASDFSSAGGLVDRYRPQQLAPWFTVDARITYKFTDWVRVGVQASNLLNSGGRLIKNDNFPFDYAIEGARVLGILEIDINNFNSP
jgi:outer membrane receptor protein involved in Fe transport